ncbi:MAG: hypothetical protein ACREOO_10385 [bacterium]
MKKISTPLSRVRRLGLPLLIFLGLVVYDVMIGGAIAALLQSDGFTPQDQRINNVHQLGYGLVTAGTLLWLYARARCYLPVLALAVLFAGFAEDTLFYFLIPVCNPMIRVITGGVEYQTAGGGFMPQQISGWTGWVGRMVAHQNVAFTAGEVLVINGIAVLLAMVLLLRYTQMR